MQTPWLWKMATRPASGVYGPDATGTYYRYRQSDGSMFSIRPPGAWSAVPSGSSAYTVAVGLIPKLNRLDEAQAVALNMGRVAKGADAGRSGGLTNTALSLVPNALLPSSMQPSPELPPPTPALPPWVLPVAIAGGVTLLALVLLPPKPRAPAYERSYGEVR